MRAGRVSQAGPTLKSSRRVTIFLALTLLALVGRLAFVIAQSRFSIFEMYFVAADSVLYLELASNIASGHGLTLDGDPTAYVGPGYPLFLTPLILAGLGPLGIGIVQSFIGAATAALAGLAARELALAARFDGHRAWTAALLTSAATALYPHLIFWTGYVLTETLFVFLLSLAAFSLTRGVRLSSTAWMVMAGSSFGLSALTRPPALAAAAVVVLWLILEATRSRRFALPVAFLIALSLPVGAWAIRNAVELGTPVVTSTESGYVFYQGNSRGATGGTRGYVDGHDFTDLVNPAGLGEVERDALYLRRAISDVLADPGETVRRWPTKVWNMWRPTYEGASTRNVIITLASYLPVLALGLAGALWLSLRSGPGTVLPLLLLMTWIAIHVLVTGMIRFRLAAELFLLISGPFALLGLIDRRRPMRPVTTSE